jgi:CheY-like chemotaxis protein
MEAVGRLAGGVAHDFNNLLTVITTNANLSLLEIPEDDPCRPSFSEIQDAARRAGALTRQLLAFGRRQVIALKPLDLSAHVAGMEDMLRRLLGEDLELSFELDRELLPVMADRGQVEQVLVNLAVNARDALPAGGRITVTTRARSVSPARAGDDRLAGRYGVLSVRDTGQGMPPEVRERVFEPFFTTKQHGTGLGLATVYGIARQHGGFVDVESEPGRGSAFHVFFPLAPASAVAVEAPERAPGPLPGGDETLLLVEDEDAVRHATRLLLERLGYRVLAARDGAEGLATAASFDGPIHLLVTDVVMPRMSGRELARAIVAHRPGLPVLYVSGYSREVVTGHGLLEPGLRLLQKPFDPMELAQAVRELLGLAGVSPPPGGAPRPPASSA